MTSTALSLKQPWATLLVHGHKTIEIRKWPTARLGRILIHAARVSDPRDYAWELVPPELAEHAQLVGGIVGSAELSECVVYRTLEAFRTDRHLHLNPPEWFQPPMMYGFRFREAAVLPFRAYSGWMRFFTVEDEEPAS
jgi:hypothetical protein